MELLLIRHAMAEPAKGEGEEADDARPLSPEGIRRFRKVVKGLEGLGLTPDHFLTIPKRRALETAKRLTHLLKGETRVPPTWRHPLPQPSWRRSP
ncbi:MAG: SixA phosphatase family protein [Thermus caldifontis]